MERKVVREANNITHWTWIFTDDEKATLQDALSGYDDKLVEDFINEIELFCKYTKVILDGSDITLERDGIKKIVKGLKKGFDACELYLSKKVQLDRPQKLSDIFDPTFEATRPELDEIKLKTWLWHQFFNTQMRLRSLIELLEFVLEETKRKPGERRTTDYTEIVKYLAHAFSNQFEKPTSYESGRFRGVVEATLNALDLPSKSPDRAIRKAIQNLPTT